MEGDCYMKKEIPIDLSDVLLEGNVLDIGSDNYGIIYNLLKISKDEEICVDYVYNEEENSVEKYYYDSAVMFFYFSSLWSKQNKKSLILDIFNFLKDSGELYIWDINKNFNKTFDSCIKVFLPGEQMKSFRYSDHNLLKDTNMINTISLIQNYFDIIETREWEEVYFIKARKKEGIVNESTLSWNKFKVHTQQSSYKIFKGIYQRLKL